MGPCQRPTYTLSTQIAISCNVCWSLRERKGKSICRMRPFIPKTTKDVCVFISLPCWRLWCWQVGYWVAAVIWKDLWKWQCILLAPFITPASACLLAAPSCRRNQCAQESKKGSNSAFYGSISPLISLVNFFLFILLHWLFDFNVRYGGKSVHPMELP